MKTVTHECEQSVKAIVYAVQRRELDELMLRKFFEISETRRSQRSWFYFRLTSRKFSHLLSPSIFMSVHFLRNDNLEKIWSQLACNRRFDHSTLFVADSTIAHGPDNIENYLWRDFKNFLEREGNKKMREGGKWTSISCQPVDFLSTKVHFSILSRALNLFSRWLSFIFFENSKVSIFPFHSQR